MVYVIGGYSNSTYIRRFIIYLLGIKTSFRMIMSQTFIQGVNLEANLYGNCQSITDMFRDELIPMLQYSIYNKDLTPYHGELMKLFRQSISYLLSYSILETNYYHYNVPQIFMPFDQNIGEVEISDIARTTNSMFAENFYLFSCALLYGVFNREIHVSVLREMLRSFEVAFHELAEDVMSY